MKTASATHIPELTKLLGVLREHQDQLLELIERKIDAMKRADAPTLAQLGEREQTLVRRIEEREGLRRQLMDTIGSELGLAGRAGRTLTVSQLAARLPDGLRTPMLAEAHDLREVTLRVTRANRVAGSIAREVVTHMQWVFASVRPREGRPACYSDRGTTVESVATRIFEAVG